MNTRLLVSIATVALVGCIGMFGCSSSNSATKDSQASDNKSEAQQAQNDTASTDAASQKYAVTIDDCVVTTDYTGAPAIVVTYTWTNNSDDAQMFMVAIDDKAYQNGIELEFATISASDTTFDTQSSMKEIKPGTTQTVQKAFLLDDQTDVTIECSELISFSDELLAEHVFSVA